MRPTVSEVFPMVSTIFEGRCSWMYLDIENLVTTGVGDLIDPMPLAQQLPWMKPDGTPANDAEIALEWTLVKNRTDLAQHGGSAYAVLTKLRLSSAAIDVLVRNRLMQMEAIFTVRFEPGVWDALCADAQLGCLSMCWAMGPKFQFPKFMAAIAEGNFAEYVAGSGEEDDELVEGCAAMECYIPDAKNPGLVPRNKFNRQLFEAAQRVSDQGLDPSVLHYKDA